MPSLPPWLLHPQLEWSILINRNTSPCLSRAQNSLPKSSYFRSDPVTACSLWRTNRCFHNPRMQPSTNLPSWFILPTMLAHMWLWINFVIALVLLTSAAPRLKRATFCRASSFLHVRLRFFFWVRLASCGRHPTHCAESCCALFPLAPQRSCCAAATPIAQTQNPASKLLLCF